MEDAPLLKADGALVYSSPDSFRRHYELYLARGGALVRPEAPLRPLEQVHVRIALPEAGEVALEAQVANLMGALCLLHFTDLTEEAAGRLRRAAEGSPPDPLPPPIPDGTEPPLPDAPSEELLREVAALVASIPPEEPSSELPPPPPPPTPAADLRLPPQPPSPAIMPVTPPPASPPLDLQPVPSPPPAPARQGPLDFVLVDAAPGPGPGIPQQISAAAVGPLPGATPAPPPPVHPGMPPPPPGPSTAAAAAGLLNKSDRPFKNPATPQDFLALPLLRPPAVEQAPEPSIPLVLQWVAALKAPSLSVRVKLGRLRDVMFYVLWGQEVRSSTPIDALVRTLGELSGQLEIVPAAEGAKAPFSSSLTTIRFAALREVLKRYTETDLATGMSARMGMSPRLNAHGMGLLRVLGLSESQLRMAQRLLAGQHPLDTVLNNGIGIRSTWQVIYLEQLLGGLTWVEPPPRESVVVEELRILAERLRLADHFEALGLHYTSPPGAVDRAHERMQREYGPGSRAAARSAKLAGDIWQRAQQAYSVIKTAGGRKQYRKERFPNVRMDYAAQIVCAQSQLAEMRGELELAVGLMEAAVELSPTPDIVAHLQRVRAKKTSG